MPDLSQEPTITVTTNGPYRVAGAVAICDVDGRVLQSNGICYLCRCGGSRNKPFCDATHGLKGFDGTETATRDGVAERRDRYDTDDLVVFDDRSRCAHFGQCTDRLPAVFRAVDEPFVDPTGAPADEVRDVTLGCPSGALASGPARASEPVEVPAGPSITPIADGPYRVRGVRVVAADGDPYEVRERQTLCRCGQSGSKPFCDGSHWYAGFRDPQPEAEVVQPPTPYEWAGGLEAFERLTERFYADILAEPDPVLEPVFAGMDPGHPKHVAAWLAETFGGERAYTHDHGGYEAMVGHHRNLALTEVQRARWVQRMVATADLVGLPDDPDFRATLLSYLEWGTRIAVFNSAPGVEVIEHAPVPRWGWGNSAPYVPQPWDDPDAAARGRERYARDRPLRPRSGDEHRQGEDDAERVIVP